MIPWAGIVRGRGDNMYGNDTYYGLFLFQRNLITTFTEHTNESKLSDNVFIINGDFIYKI